jgi:hypothetical protein
VAGARSASVAAPIPVLHPARLRRSFPATTARRLFPPHHRAHQLPRGIISSQRESQHAAPTANPTIGDPHHVLFFSFPASICLCDSFCFLAFFLIFFASMIHRENHALGILPAARLFSQPSSRAVPLGGVPFSRSRRPRALPPNVRLPGS